MKANEAQKKIWLGKYTQNLMLSDPNSNTYVEYVRKDTFVDKACEWLSNVSIEDMTYKYNNFDTSEGWYKFIEDFRKYMSL